MSLFRLMTNSIILRLIFIQKRKRMKQILTLLLLSIALTSHAGEIVVHEGESIHDALRQAREWRRTNDPRCKGGITITLKAGRYFMQEPLFLRPEDSGTKESPLVIRGIGEKHTSVICGDARQRHTQPSTFSRSRTWKWWFTSDGPSPSYV